MTRRTEVYPSSNNQYCLDTTAMVAVKVLSCDIEVIPAEEATSGKITVFLKNPPNEVQGVAFEFDTDIEATCFLKDWPRAWRLV